MLETNLLQRGEIAPAIEAVLAELSGASGTRAALQGTLAPFAEADGWMFTLASASLIAAVSLTGGIDMPEMQRFFLAAEQMRTTALAQDEHNQIDDVVMTLAVLHGIATFWAAVERVVAARP